MQGNGRACQCARRGVTCSATLSPIPADTPSPVFPFLIYRTQKSGEGITLTDAISPQTTQQQTSRRQLQPTLCPPHHNGDPRLVYPGPTLVSLLLGPPWIPDTKEAGSGPRHPRKNPRLKFWSCLCDYLAVWPWPVA